MEVRPNLYREIAIDESSGYELTEPGERERIKIRLAGVDTPEIKGEERAEGIISRDWVVSQIGHLGHVYTEMIKEDPFGRWLNPVYYEGKNLADEALAAGMAEKYTRSVGSDEPIMKVPW